MGAAITGLHRHPRRDGHQQRSTGISTKATLASQSTTPATNGSGGHRPHSEALTATTGSNGKDIERDRPSTVSPTFGVAEGTGAELQAAPSMS